MLVGTSTSLEGRQKCLGSDNGNLFESVITKVGEVSVRYKCTLTHHKGQVFQSCVPKWTLSEKWREHTKETSREFLEDVVRQNWQSGICKFGDLSQSKIPVPYTVSCYRGLTQSSQCREKGLSVLQRFKQLPENLLVNNKLNSHAYLQRRHNQPLQGNDLCVHGSSPHSKPRD